MNLTSLALRFRWLQLPTGLLFLLLQRTPMLRVALQCESLFAGSAPVILRSLFTVAALGAYNSMAGATVFNVTAAPTAASPTSGAANATFAVAEDVGTGASIAVSVSGAPGNPKSYSVSGTLPAGLTLTNAVGTYVNVVAPYKMTISGTPTAAGTYPLTITAWDGSNGTGGNSAKIKVNVTVAGAATTAPAITTQPTSVTVTAGGAASFTVAASGTPAPTYQWQKGGVNIAGATSSTFSIASVAAGDAGNYTAVATNSAGSATSSAATLTVSAAATAPAITAQPASVTVTAGGAASFTVAASGAPAPTYQWQKGGVNIAGATSATFSIASTVAGDAGNYTAVATNSAGSATSNGATLTVNPATSAPAITTQPVSQTVAPGNAASFSVVASGVPAPTYQWQKGGVNLAGATGATFTLASVGAGDAGNYTVVVTNSAGSATSNAATLTVSLAPAAPVITTQPLAQTVTVGGAVAFTVSASGNPAPTYQWQKGGVNITGATSATFSIASVTSGDAGNYTVIATNSVGSATSSAATLTVGAATAAPSITTSPSSQTVSPGGAVSFTVAASGNPAPTYQWQKGGANIAGATSATYSIASVVTDDAGSYTVVATNSAGSATSAAATLTVSTATSAPAITTQPANQTVAAGGSASFTVAASGNPTPTYQWYFGGAVLSGATSATLSLGNVQPANAGDYYATATNSAGSAISASARLSLQAQTSVVLASSQQVVVGHDAAIAAVGAAGAVQWQVSTDNGLTWQNLSDNTAYSGATGLVLEILKVTAAQHGSQYRCLVSGVASSATTLKVVQAYFAAPTSVGGDSAGNLYVTDASAQTVQKIDSTGQVTLLAGGAGQSGSVDGAGAVARFNQPGALAVAADGMLYVADTANNLVRSVTATGTVSLLAGAAGTAGVADGTGAAARFAAPSAIARDATGFLFVADSLNHTIRKLSSGGAVTTFAGSAGSAGATDGTGSGARFNRPAGVAVDSAGNVYVSDAANHLIRKITPAGVVTTLAGQAGVSGAQDGSGAAARFNRPGGLAVGSAGELYLADTGNSTIRKITPAGTVTTVAGLAGISGLMDGKGGYAWFDQPTGLTVGTDGNLYVADTGNALIRQVTLAGNVTTLALTTGTTSSPTPTPGNPSPTPNSGSGASPATSAGAGGGANDPWLAVALALALLVRRRRRNQRHADAGRDSL